MQKYAMNSQILSWIADGLAKPGKSKGGLAKKLGVHQSAVTRILDGTRKIQIHEVPIIAEYIGNIIPDFDPSTNDILQSLQRIVDENEEHAANPHAPPVHVLGEVAAGVWRDVSAIDQAERDDSPFPTDTRYPAAAQFDLIVRGTSINRIARDGDHLRCVDVVMAGIEVAGGELVIVRRTRDDGQLVEITAKRIRKIGLFLELWPDSDDPQWQKPIHASTQNDPDRETVEIAALVLYVYRPIPRGR